MDNPAPLQSAARPAARQRPRPDAENFGGEVSFSNLPLTSDNSITSSARNRNDSGIVSPSAVAVFIDGQLESDRLHKQASDLACIGSGPRSQRDNYENIDRWRCRRQSIR